MSTLGERIRTLRKQQKMTLEALAGDQLTKGMLSLIENNKANPSMDSLTYIAERLGVEVAELMEEVSLKELRDVLKVAEKLFSVEFDELTDEHEQIIVLIEPYIEKLSHGYEAARLLDIYSRSLYYEKKEGWQELLNKAGVIYDQMNIIPRLAAVGIFRAMVEFTAHDYDRALELLLKERSDIESRNAFIDPLTRLDFYYLEAVLHYAVGNAVEAIQVMNEGIEFSKEKQIFYRTDHLYRIATFHAMMNNDVQSMEYYERKLLLYGDFADDQDAIFFTKFASVHYLTSYKKDFEEALAIINAHFDKQIVPNAFLPYALLEKGKALFGINKYEEALSCFKKVIIADYVHHPFDLSIFYEKDAYAALCYLSLGDKKKAITAIRKAVANVDPMPYTPYKKFIMETFVFIKERLD